jgi:hypothetical protein
MALARRPTGQSTIVFEVLHLLAECGFRYRHPASRFAEAERLSYRDKVADVEAPWATCNLIRNPYRSKKKKIILDTQIQAMLPPEPERSC